MTCTERFLDRWSVNTITDDVMTEGVMTKVVL